MESEEKIAIRPTKKQRELLTFIEDFITANGYSPSYREIMNGLKYTSVATVALHVNNLIKRGHLQKRDRSARSLEVVNSSKPKDTQLVPKQLNTTEEKWLIDKVEAHFKAAETALSVAESDLDQLHILVGALRVLGASGASNSYAARLSELKKKQDNNQFSV